MERAGVKLDVAELQQLAISVDAGVKRLQDEIYVVAGETFNIGSPQQLGRILFDKLGLPAGRQNKTGYATGVDVLHGLARSFPSPPKCSNTAKSRSSKIPISTCCPPSSIRATTGCTRCSTKRRRRPAGSRP